ncbi:transposase [Massilia agilis]|uniref:Transposase n=1 Tax=Massilia agilis TaxID=1811226 RepID=A0ABT2D856_9BURK|nr:transposase [Massilia agilis]MCS0807465.1 transposase [Massilia agilis]
MSRYRRVIGSTFFFTVVAYRRREILCDERIRCALNQAIRLVASQRPFAIDAWVLLPDHMHVIWTLPEGDHDFSTRWSEIKRFVSTNCGGAFHRPVMQTEAAVARRESTIWQRRFWEHRIRDEHDLEIHMDYVHFNPVRHGYVTRADQWPFSTFHRYVSQGMYPVDWGGNARVSGYDLE